MVLAIDFMMDKISEIICFYMIKLVDYERLSHKHLSGTQKGVPVKLYPIDHSRNTITYHNALCLSPQNFA